MTNLANLVVVAIAAGLGACSERGPLVDVHTTAIVVEKIQAEAADEPGVIRAVTDDASGTVVAFSLKGNEKRPLSYIWANLDVGSNIAFVTLQPNGEAKHHPDGIFALDTTEIVLLDEPADLEVVKKIAREERRAMMLAEDKRREALNKMWHQAHAPRE